MGEEEFRVGPCSPFGGVDVVGQVGALGVGEMGEEGLGGGDDGGDGDAFVLEGEEVVPDGSWGG